MSNAFEKTLRELRGGQALAECSEGLAALVAAVRAMGKKGKLTLELVVKPASRGNTNTLMVDSFVKVSPPESEPEVTIFFATDENGLSRTDPRQPELQLKAVPKPEQPTELKQAI